MTWAVLLAATVVGAACWLAFRHHRRLVDRRAGDMAQLAGDD